MSRTSGMARALLGPLVVIGATLAGCGSSAVAPAPPTIAAIGILASQAIAGSTETYTLTDGRAFEISQPATRLLFMGGTGRLFVMGRDTQGPFVGVFLTQAGLPSDCFLAGLAPKAIEFGAYVDIGGVMWRKAAGFHSSQHPASGQTYDASTRFCFNASAEVTYAV